MNDALRKSFETLLKNGDYVKAETELKNFMMLKPEDRDAKMLFGTCRMLQGDTETAKRIHDELEPYYPNSDSIPKSENSFWKKYRRWIICGTVATLALVICGIYITGRNIAMTLESPPIKYRCKKCGKLTERTDCCGSLLRYCHFCGKEHSINYVCEESRKVSDRMWKND